MNSIQRFQIRFSCGSEDSGVTQRALNYTILALCTTTAGEMMKYAFGNLLYLDFEEPCLVRSEIWTGAQVFGGGGGGGGEGGGDCSRAWQCWGKRSAYESQKYGIVILFLKEGRMYCGGWIFTKLCCFLQNTTSMTSEAICIHFSRVGRLSSESELTPTYP